MAEHELIAFLNAGLGSTSVAEGMERLLGDAGFVPLNAGLRWELSPGQGYYCRFGGALTAFRVGLAEPVDAGFVIIGAHSDSPALQLKTASASIVDRQLVIPTEVYGSPILATWMDRDLVANGRLIVESERGKIRPVRVGDTKGAGGSADGPQASIPNLAVHFDRETRERTQYNPHEHIRALCGEVPDGLDVRTAVQRWLAAYLPDDTTRIIDADLWLHSGEAVRVWGPDSELISGSRIDNLCGAWSTLTALVGAAPRRATQVAFILDHEEIGSVTAQGAAGGWVEHTLRRIAGDREPDTFPRAIARSVLVSNDAGHARHPNYVDRHDAGYAPVLGGGVVMKKSAVKRYATEPAVVAWVAQIAHDAKVPLQWLQNRADVPAGSTIGPALTARVGVRGIDLGLPILAMHSIRETAHRRDIAHLQELLRCIYEESPDAIPDLDSAR